MSEHTKTKTTSTTLIPGHVPGHWVVDLAHSDVSFVARHLVSKGRGRFARFNGEITAAPDPFESSVIMEIDAASIDTNNAQRDEHLRSADFLEAATYPTLRFASTGIRANGSGFLIDGDLMIKDVTRPITAELAVHGFASDRDGDLRAGYSVAFGINRRDFNVNFHWILETGGAMVGDRIDIQLDVEAVLQH